MKLIILFTILLAINFSHAQVGIGTTTPSTNSALDVNSTSKGIMLPRLSDTTNVTNPSAGLMIYNVNTKAPTFHNGIRWNTVATQLPPTSDTDSITYTITNASNGFTNGTFTVESITNGAQNNGGSSFLQDINFLKRLDINSIPFAKAVAASTTLSSMVIEFNVYLPNSNTPDYSIKATNIIITSFSVGISTDDTNVYESISLLPVIFGYKDWVNDISFGWNDATNLVVPY